MKRSVIIAGGIVVGLVLVCVVGWLIYASASRYGADDGMRGARLLSLPGAGSEGEVVVEKVVVQSAAPEEPLAYDTVSVAYAAERLIIRSGNISMVVDDTRAVRATIEELVAGMAGDGAFVVSSQEYGGTEGEQPRVSMTIRVPAARFDATMDRLADLAVRVTNRNESADDVTEEYVDLEARLESLEAARQRLLDIMAEARSTKDLLEAEQQLTQREAEIESIKGRMQYLEQSARLSSISIELVPDILSQPVSDQWRPAETARRAVEALVDSLRALGSFAIFFSIAILPWLVMAGLLILVVAWL
ncbi:MAG: DUF4349 domain-containing protein, partial [Anaerolineae bacterium]|nr:DUF4349 domain-containing protein [Anaerolineae bacterium]